MFEYYIYQLFYPHQTLSINVDTIIHYFSSLPPDPPGPPCPPGTPRPAGPSVTPGFPGPPALSAH